MTLEDSLFYIYNIRAANMTYGDYTEIMKLIVSSHGSLETKEYTILLYNLSFKLYTVITLHKSYIVYLIIIYILQHLFSIFFVLLFK